MPEGDVRHETGLRIPGAHSTRDSSFRDLHARPRPDRRIEERISERHPGRPLCRDRPGSAESLGDYVSVLAAAFGVSVLAAFGARSVRWLVSQRGYRALR